MTQTSDTLLRLQDVSKRFGKKTALDHISLEIAPGRMVGLLGTNGSGKSTLIKLINGLLVPSSGQIFICGQAPGPETKAIVSYLPERTYLPDTVRVKGLLSFFRDFYADFDAAKAEEMLQKLDIDPSSPLKTLSKGTREKVQLIMVMSRRARVYILDEPIAGVDPAARDYILKTIIQDYSEDASILLHTLDCGRRAASGRCYFSERRTDHSLFQRGEDPGHPPSVRRLLFPGGILMLTKLISHEWKDTFKVPALLLTITVLLSAASLVYFSVADQASAGTDLNVRNFVLYIAYILILSGLSMILMIYFTIRFYKNLYTDEGYLMHTLPVKPWMLIVSKLTIGTIWFYLIDLLLVGAITLITLIALPTMAYFSPEDLLELRTMFQSYHTIFTVPSILFLAIPVMIIGSVFSLLTIYASISLGQLFSSHKVLASILCYLGLSTILSTAMMLLTAPTTAGVFIIQSTSANPMADFASIYWSIMLISLFVNLILCVPAFWICNYVMKRCLNLD